ncbi:16S rRNA (adenine(1518)-N(6)/adenine(1519)-N(6))-dimethyltransferase RsmA [Magnetospira sp. QH-2]|uniref:16S rRNA (adenine(1518)-N(6)/adenine(1519)-N(6))- dimethyltransferase RsmA n=1 Tax=Magnetospira sp. (strain QH-2) TaxID=1288970 RepID=UPI0003E80CB0|nr:16S rRNA (adenine(1518)-N(6)/adenine(1519)-N(6))-dimethyltransferase RsmA [Magnetospira sp. QH-2]CCQ74415.1 Dimethyladenosine transferase (S-adenosylmethionine-6-N', N'-adenosyl(rRNA) dimethyltransferase) (16S rRNA dimethylase) (High level kasugamycin resistance protein ksgA) (Kasugamycin dimethyltransferase) [Magnetospira sp. QH-2]
MPDLPPLRDVIARHGLRARKSLGQNFLLDLNLTGRIARAAGVTPGMNVIEIGPGPGGLTRALLAAGAFVQAIEMDERCIGALSELGEAYPGQLTLHQGDALKVDVTTLCPAPRRIVANLPYNVATPLLLGWLRQVAAFDSFTLMFQKEVADRLLAEPGTKAYGRLAVITQWLCDVQREFNVDKAAFTPPPKIMSTVVTLTPRPAPLAPANWECLEKVTAAAFGQRRKMLRASLKPLNLDLEALGITPTARAEELPVEAFCTLARAIEYS